MKVLQKNPSERYQSSDDFLADLQSLRAGDRVQVSLPGRKASPRRLLLIAAAAAIVVAAIALWPRLTRWFGPAPVTATTLAVVDFENIDGEEANHLAVGLAEGICVKLSKVAGIKVVSSDDIRRLRKDDLSAKEIAARLFVSVDTVKTHLKNLYQKLGVNNRREAAHKALAILAATPPGSDTTDH